MNPFEEILNKLEKIDTKLNREKDSEIKEILSEIVFVLDLITEELHKSTIEQEQEYQQIMPASLEIEGFFVCQVLNNKRRNIKWEFAKFCANKGK